MSKPLEKMHIPALITWKQEQELAGLVSQTMVALNAAIDRVNELEAKYEDHTHDVYDSNIKRRVQTTHPLPSGKDGVD